MIKTEKINGKIFLTQTTYYIYVNEDAQKTDHPSLVTSDKTMFEHYRKNEKNKKNDKVVN